MERENKTIELSNCKVKIITFLTWGEKEKINSVLMEGAKIDNTGIAGYDSKAILEKKYKLLELCILEIKENENIVKFNREWMDGLSVNDGDKLYNEVEKLENPEIEKKK